MPGLPTVKYEAIGHKDDVDGACVPLIEPANLTVAFDPLKGFGTPANGIVRRLRRLSLDRVWHGSGSEDHGTLTFCSEGNG